MSKCVPPMCTCLDGRRMIDGKIEDVESGAAMVLWGNTLLRGAVRTHMKVQDVTNAKKPEENVEEEPEQKPEPATEVKGEHGEYRLLLIHLHHCIHHLFLAGEGKG